MADRAERIPGRRQLQTAGSMVLLLFLLMVGLCGCGTDDIDISGCADETITISGITDEEVTLTVADLKAMDCVTKTCESTSDKIGKVRATGPTLDTVLREFGMSQKELSRVHICGKDEYDVKLDSDVLAEEEIILAFGAGGGPLPAEDAPVRIIIPGSDSAWWVRMVERIELED